MLSGKNIKSAGGVEKRLGFWLDLLTRFAKTVVGKTLVVSSGRMATHD